MEQDHRSLTFGEQLVGLTFNPSGDPEVQRAKEICAELADITERVSRRNNLRANSMKEALYNHTIGQILNAQMNVVKLITIK